MRAALTLLLKVLQYARIRTNYLLIWKYSSRKSRKYFNYLRSLEYQLKLMIFYLELYNKMLISLEIKSLN
jgi:hypothetical protein